MSLKSIFLNLIFPIECLACGQEGDWLCENCFQKLKFNSDYKKYNLKIPNLTQIFIAGDYDNQLLATLIKKFKYNFVNSLGIILAKFLIIFWQKLENSGNLKKILSEKKDLPILIPIPLSKKRQRWRGFNQAKILAQEFGKVLNYPINSQLKKRKQSKPQASLSENKRAINILNTFSWTGDRLQGQNVILIDDVLTTGATLNEAARVLLSIGAGKVYALVLAKG